MNLEKKITEKKNKFISIKLIIVVKCISFNNESNVNSSRTQELFIRAKRWIRQFSLLQNWKCQENSFTTEKFIILINYEQTEPKKNNFGFPTL